MSKSPVLEIRDLGFSWPGRDWRLQLAGLTLDAGETMFLHGPSGTGKSTLLNLVAGTLAKPDGVLRVCGRDLKTMSGAARDRLRADHLGIVFQQFNLLPFMSMRANVLLPCRFSRRRSQAAQLRFGSPLKAAEALLQRLGMGDAALRDAPVVELSVGQQQRVAVARAIVLEPSVLLFDEPLSNLDAKLRRKVRDDIRDLQSRLGLTVLYVTHDQEEALAVSDKVIVMDNAVIAQEGTPSDLYERPKTRFLADFIGEANLIDGTFSSNAQGATFSAHGMTLDLGAVQLPEHAKTLAFRPDRVGIAPDPASPLAIRRQAYIGPSREYVIDAPWGELLIVRPVREPIIPNGTAVRLLMEPGAAMAIPG